MLEPLHVFKITHNSTAQKGPSTPRAEATFSLCEMLCKKWPLSTSVQFSIVNARNSSRDSQAKLIVRSVIK